MQPTNLKEKGNIKKMFHLLRIAFKRFPAMILEYSKRSLSQTHSGQKISQASKTIPYTSYTQTHTTTIHQTQLYHEHLLFFLQRPQKKRQLRKKNLLLFWPLWLEDVLLQQWQKASRATGYWSLHVPSTPLTLRSAGLALRGHGGRLIGWCCWWQLGGGLLSCGPFSLGFTTLNGKCCYASFPTKKNGEPSWRKIILGWKGK